MLQLLSLLALLTQAFAAPQGGPTEPQGASGPPNVHNINVTVVGGTTPQFVPTNITASQNDIVVFNFDGPVPHSVTQSSFNAPCTPLQNGFNSGLQGSGAQFNVTVLDTSKPIWFYCQQTKPGPHCGLGMVGSINAPASTGNTFDTFHSLALSIGSTEAAQTVTTSTSGVGATATLLVAPTNANSTGGTSGTASSGSGASNPSPTAPSNGTNNGNKTNTADHLLPRDGMMVALVTFMGALAL